MENKQCDIWVICLEVVVHDVCSLLLAGHSGLAVKCLTMVFEDQGSNPTVSSCRFFVKTTMIYSLGHGLHNLTSVWVDSAFYPPWVGKMGISFRAE